MQLFRILCISLTVITLSAPVWAQYGLYGSPDPLQFSTARPAYEPVNGYTPANASQTAYVPQAVASRPTPGFVTPNPSYQTGYGNQAVQQNQNTAVSTPAMPNSPVPAPPSQVAQPAAPASGSNGAAAASPDNAKQRPTVMSQMLNDQGQAGGKVGSAGNGGYVPYGSQAPDCATCNGPGCGIPVCGGYCPWYGSISLLALTRDEPNKLWTSSDSLDETIQTMNTQECRSAWKWGGEIRFGRRFCCGDPCGAYYDPTSYWAVEATYWTLDRFHGYKEVWPYDPTDPLDRVNTPLRVSDVHFDSIDYGVQSGSFWFDGAGEHWLERYNEIQNVEVAFIGGRWATASGSPWDFAWSVGPRFFRFEESLTFGTVRYSFVKAADQENAFIQDRILNTFWGCQMGCDLGYNVNSRLRFYATPKAGIYGNQITNHFRMALGDGTPPIDFPAQIDSTKNCTSFLMQIDVGGEWFFAQAWSLRVGYRVLAVSGIGLADNQIPWAMPEALEGDISSNADLILHGGYLSLTYNF